MEDSASTIVDGPQMSAEEKTLREYLKSLFEILVLLGKHNIPLKADKVTDGEPLSYNLQALMDYCINAGDEALKKRFEMNAVNAEYLSAEQQSQLLDVCENTVREEILMEVRESRFFSLVTGDLVQFGEVKHLPLFLRFVNQQNVLREEFLDFVPFDSEEFSLVDKLEALLTERFGLSMEDCRGQAHKATGTNTGKMKAVAVLLAEKFSQALHLPCSHVTLNIHLANNLPYPNVHILMETLNKIRSFFKNPVTHDELLKAITTHFQRNCEKGVSLKEACSSDWTKQQRVFDLLLDLLPPLLLCMDNVRESSHFADAIRADAYTIGEILFDFEFIVTTVILKNVLTFTRAFGRNLQGETLDVFFAVNSIMAVLYSLNEIKENIDVYHEYWYEEAVAIANVMEVPVKVPRLFLRHQRAANESEVRVETHYKEYVTVPVVHGVMQELEDMFSESNLKAFKCLSLVPAVMGQMKFNTTEERYADVYSSDLPNPDTLHAELHCWRIKWKHRGKEVRLPITIQETLQLPDVKYFPNVNAFLKMLSTLPVLKLDCKEGKTASERLQAYFDSVPPKQWNKSLAMLSVNTLVNCDLDVMVDQYCRLYPEDEQEAEAETEMETEAETEAESEKGDKAGTEKDATKEKGDVEMSQ